MGFNDIGKWTRYYRYFTWTFKKDLNWKCSFVLTFWSFDAIDRCLHLMEANPSEFLIGFIDLPQENKVIQLSNTILLSINNDVHLNFSSFFNKLTSRLQKKRNDFLICLLACLDFSFNSNDYKIKIMADKFVLRVVEW